jgi:hypothetical protein
VIVSKLQDEDSYKFVGECYLHGFMDAGVITLQIKGVLKEQFILAWIEKNPQQGGLIKMEDDVLSMMERW